MNSWHRPAPTTPTLHCETVRHRKHARLLVTIGILIGMAVAFGSVELDRLMMASFRGDGHYGYGTHP